MIWLNVLRLCLLCTNLKGCKSLLKLDGAISRVLSAVASSVPACSDRRDPIAPCTHTGCGELLAPQDLHESQKTDTNNSAINCSVININESK